MSYLPARVIAEPVLQPGDAPYFAAADRGLLMLRGCNACGALHHYPRALCPFCFSDDLRWQPSCGRGTVYSYSVTNAKSGAYCLAYIALEEGVVVLSNVVDCDAVDVRIGLPVAVIFPRSDADVAVPMFRPIEGLSDAQS